MGSDHHQQWRRKEQSQPLSQRGHKKGLSSAEFFKIMCLLYLPCQANTSELWWNELQGVQHELLHEPHHCNEHSCPSILLCRTKDWDNLRGPNFTSVYAIVVPAGEPETASNLLFSKSNILKAHFTALQMKKIYFSSISRWNIRKLSVICHSAS